MYIGYKLIPNSDIFVKIYEFNCDKCGGYLNDSYPVHSDRENDYDLCMECAFRERKIDGDTYLDNTGISSSMFYVGINPNDEIEIWERRNPTPPWERTEKQQRNSPKYIQWRTSVLERDNYTCQHCGQKGGELNAHHIKPFAEYKELRTELSNGITLCKECHKKEHRRMKRE